jgi:sugar fermentation stimulation protein A
VAEYSPPLRTGTLLRRYKRFLADIDLGDGEVVTAHVPNTGSMLSTRDPGSRVAISYQPSPKRKLKWTLELVESCGTWVGVNTSFTNRIVEMAISGGQIPELQGYDRIQREVRYGAGSRVDLLLSRGESRCYVEVKNVTYRNGEGALFPDAVTARGTKHLRELIQMVQAGHRAVMFFLVNRDDCAFMAPAGDIDPLYTDTLIQANHLGVVLLAYTVRHSITGHKLHKQVPIQLPPPSPSLSL